MAILNISFAINAISQSNLINKLLTLNVDTFIINNALILIFAIVNNVLNFKIFKFYL